MFAFEIGFTIYGKCPVGDAFSVRSIFPFVHLVKHRLSEKWWERKAFIVMKHQRTTAPQTSLKTLPSYQLAFPQQCSAVRGRTHGKRFRSKSTVEGRKFSSRSLVSSFKSKNKSTARKVSNYLRLPKRQFASELETQKMLLHDFKMLNLWSVVEVSLTDDVQSSS